MDRLKQFRPETPSDVILNGEDPTEEHYEVHQIDEEPDIYQHQRGTHLNEFNNFEAEMEEEEKLNSEGEEASYEKPKVSRKS